MNSSSSNPSCRWAHLRPDEFNLRMRECPVALMPIGLCEPHGHIAALGLDTLKADYYCDEAASHSGGIVAPTQGYHIHESGIHAPWLEEVVGEVNPLLGGMPPYVVCYHLLYQLRAFANAGFRAIIVVSGHSGGSQNDLRLVGDAFSKRFHIPVVIKADPEWTDGKHVGDHAGRYEISQLMAINPEWIDLSLLKRQYENDSGGRLALGEDAAESTAAFGHEINELIIKNISQQIEQFRENYAEQPPEDPQITYEAVEAVWKEVLAKTENWTAGKPSAEQQDVTAQSRWKPYEKLPHLTPSS